MSPALTGLPNCRAAVKNRSPFNATPRAIDTCAAGTGLPATEGNGLGERPR